MSSACNRCLPCSMATMPPNPRGPTHSTSALWGSRQGNKTPGWVKQSRIHAKGRGEQRERGKSAGPATERLLAQASSSSPRRLVSALVEARRIIWLVFVPLASTIIVSSSSEGRTIGFFPPFPIVYYFSSFVFISHSHLCIWEIWRVEHGLLACGRSSGVWLLEWGN